MMGSPAQLASLVAALTLVLSPLAADAGYAVLDQQGQTLLVSKGRIKHVPREAEQPVVAFDVGRDRLWFANPRTRSYWEGTAEEYCTAMKGMLDATMGAADERLREQLGKLPPAQRAQVEQMLRQMRGGQPGAAAASEPAPRITVERTAEEVTIAGQTARKIRVLANGQPSIDVWLGNDAGLVQELQLARAPDTYGRLAGCLAARPGGAASSSAAVFQSAQYKQLYGQGWPLRVVTYAQGSSHTVIDVTRIEPRDIAEGEFAPPAGFRKATLPEVFGVAAGLGGGR